MYALHTVLSFCTELSKKTCKLYNIQLIQQPIFLKIVAKNTLLRPEEAKSTAREATKATKAT